MNKDKIHDTLLVLNTFKETTVLFRLYSSGIPHVQTYRVTVIYFICKLVPSAPTMTY